MQPRGASGEKVVEKPVADACALAVAAGQCGVITSAQLLDAGLSHHAIAHRVCQGWLWRLHHGVFVVGPHAPAYAREMAAVLAIRPDAVSHRSATGLWELGPLPADVVDVTVTASGRRSRAGIRVHRARELPASDITTRHGIPVTTPLRTLLDLAAVAVEPALTRSEAERRLLALIRAAGLPRPRTNVRIGPHEVDAVWAQQRVVVEVDGFAFHGTRSAFERDRRRDAELAARRFTVLRFTWRELSHRPEVVIARIAAVLAREVTV